MAKKKQVKDEPLEKQLWKSADKLICSTEFQNVYPKNKDSLYFLYGGFPLMKIIEK